MSKNTIEIPFTEIIERVRELLGFREEVSSKIRGVVNDIYLRDITKKEDWSFLIARSSLTFTEEFTTGNATINTGGTTVTFSSTFVADSGMIGRRIKFSNNDNIYDVNGLSSSTGVTIQPPLSGTQNITSQSYSIFRTTYPLAGDFDRFPKNGGLYLFYGGQPKRIPEKDYGYYVDNYQPTPSENQEFCRLIGTDTAGNRLIEIVPPSKSSISAQYDYLKRLRPMRQTTSGVISMASNGATTVTGSAGTTRFTEATTGDFFRVDAFGQGGDSEWYRIIAIANDSSLTLATAFGTSAATSANYTICSAPDMPAMLHPAVLYGTITQMSATQDDPMVVGYKGEYASVLSDGKRLYKTRMYRQEIANVSEEYHYRR